VTTTTSIRSEWPTWLSWIIASLIGWVVGLIVGLSVTLNEGLVAATLGVAIGMSQWFVLTPRLVNGVWWIGSTAFGVLLGTAVSGILGFPIVQGVDFSLGFDIPPWSPSGIDIYKLRSVSYVLGGPEAGFLIGTAVGTAQWIVMRKRVGRAGWWIVANGLGWAVAFLCGFLMSGFTKNLFAVAAIAGLVGGTITALPFVRLVAGDDNRVPHPG